jgi:PTS system mannitol-specific IIC component
MEQQVEKKKVSLKARVQKLGSTLSSMVMPNIGALIAWGVLTALFMESGYFPNKGFAAMISPMLTYLIPLLIGYTGGKVIGGDRGAVAGAIATMGVIVGADIPMMLGAMIMGPLGGYAVKKFDQLVEGKIKAGFEMLVNNFSVGLLGFVLALIGNRAVGPIVDSLTQAMAKGVEVIITNHLTPLASIFIEPAKILFLNNAINHGILTPLGTEQALASGKSILFLLESNPGPGLGVLLAFTLFGRGTAKSTAPGAIIIQFLGGIHEIYFPYVMMKPLLFLSVISGGVTGTFVFQTLGAGLRAPASPGSIIAILAMTPFGSYIPVIAGVISATAASFVVSMVILKADAKEEAGDAFDKAVQNTNDAHASAKGKITTSQPVGLSASANLTDIQSIIFACDAGMGSSAMGASILRKKVQTAGLPQKVTNKAINNLTDDAHTLIVTQVELQERAKQKAPSATFVAVENFLNSPRYEEIVADLLNPTDTVNAPTTETIAVAPGETLDDATLDSLFSVEQLKGVTQIVIAHDERVGSATMADKVLRDILAKDAVTVPVTVEKVEEIAAGANTLVITKEYLTEEVQQKAPNALHVSVANLLQNDLYQQLADNLKQLA